MAQVTPAEIATLDPYYDNVSLLVIGDSITKPGLTPYGNVSVSTVQKPFTVSSAIVFDGSGDYLAAGNRPDLVLGSDNFTVEFFCYFKSSYTSAPFGKWSGGLDRGFVFYVWNEGLQFSYSTTGTNQINHLVSDVMTLNVWKHYAICRDGANLRIFKDGVQIGITYNIGTSSIYNNSLPFYIGAVQEGLFAPLNGCISNFRLTKYVARYISNFTPPTAEFPWIKYGNHGFTSALGLRSFAPPEALDSLGIRKISRGQPIGNRDIYYGGNGMITGTVKNTPNTPVYRRVQLIHDATKSIIRETWSDAITGIYTFTNIDRNSTYTVLSYDHTGAYRAVIADQQTPTT